jgi:hypothetical protein
MLRRLLFIGITVGAMALTGQHLSQLKSIFCANIPLNSLILALLATGIFAMLAQWRQLRQEILWMTNYREGRPRPGATYFPKILAPVMIVLGQRDTAGIAPESTRMLLDVVRDRIDENRQLPRYLINVLIFLGLLGTFWGLLQTISSISQVIGSLPSTGGESIAFFEHLKQGLQAPLGGMGIAFSASMFGLAASVLLGFLDTQIGRQYRLFYHEVEEWLLSLPSVPVATQAEVAELSNPIFLGNLVEKLAIQLQDLRQMVAHNTDHNAGLSKNILLLSERTSAIADFMKTEQNLMLKIAEHQLDLQNLLKAFHEDLRSGAAGVNEVTQNHIRNLDVTVTQLTSQLSTQNNRTIAEICSEIRLLTKTIGHPHSPDPHKVAV